MAGIRLLASALVCCGLIAACRPSGDGNEVAPGNGARNDSEAALPPPVTPKILNREELLLAVGRSASSVALGRDDLDAQRTLDGQQYEFRMRFGCGSGESPERNAYSVAFDEAKRTLRLGATPEINASDPLITAVATGEIEAVEGFWVEQPWLLDVGCPSTPMPALPAAAAELQAEEPAQFQQAPPPVSSRIGLAQFFGPEESRTLRRNSRAYQVTKTLPEEVSPSASGYDLVLSGRLRKMANGRVIACSNVSATARPSCVVSVSFDRVSIRRGDNDELLAEWGGG
jgi:hypothetical protein